MTQAAAKKDKKYRKRRRQGRMIAIFFKLLSFAMRYRMIDRFGIEAQIDEPKIFVLWHNRLFSGLFWAYRFLGPSHRLACLVSPSSDGEVLVAALESLGFSAARGSSSREGSRGVKELVQRIRDGEHVAITPDGPRGPCYHMTRGALTVAKLSGAPIVPMRLDVRGKIRLKSWDRFQIPLPLARCTLDLGKPIFVTEDNEEEAKERLIEAMAGDDIREAKDA